MIPVRAFQRLILAGYLLITFAAFIYTLTRLEILPWPIIAFSYGMMAPYQSTTPYNFGMTAQAVLEDGSRRSIDLTTYYPVIAPEAAIRQYIPFTHWRNDPTAPTALAAQYDTIAHQILRAERVRDQGVQRVELFWEQWPLSIFGFETEHTPLVTDRTLIARAP